jgi:excisionase family DNA binding protein
MKQQTTINPTLRDFCSLPDSQQIRLPIVKALLGVSNATVWRMIKAGKLKAYKFTERTTTFNVGELRAFITSKMESK